jgi:PIN domain-containing protein
MSNQYVLVDFENVQPDLSQLAGSPYKVKMFFGAKQQESRVPFKLLDAVMALGGNAEAIKITRSGSNAVDMHIAWFIGGLLEREPQAKIHIISGDSDFDPLLEFLTARGVECRRTKTLAELVDRKPPRAAQAPRAPRGRPSPQPAKVVAPVKVPVSDHLSGVLKHLRSMKDKPTTRTRLAKWIDTHFRQHGGAQTAKVVERTLDDLVRLKFVTQDGTKVAYNLSS